MNFGASTLRTILIVLGSSWLTFLINILRVLVVPAKLGDHGMGQITLGLSFTGFFMAFIVLGTSTYMMRAVARDQNLLDEYVSNVLVLRILSGTSILGLIWMLSSLFGYAADTQMVIFIIGVSVVLFTIADVYSAALQAIGQIRYRAIATAIANVSTTAIGVTALLMGADVIIYSLSTVLGSFVLLVAAGGYFVFRRRIHFKISAAAARMLLISSMPLFTWAFLQGAYAQIDATVISMFADEKVIGWYGVAKQLIGVVLMVPTAINSVALPMLCELYVKSTAQFFQLATRTAISILVLLAPVGAGISLAAPEALAFIYPSEFGNAAPVLAIWALSLPVTGVLMILGSLAMATGQEKGWVKVSAAGVLIFPPLYIFLTWLFQTNMGNGAIGTALASLIGECIHMVCGWFIVPKDLRLPALLSKGGQIVLATLLMSASVLLLKAFGMPLYIFVPAGAIVYAVGAWFMKLVTPGDLQLIRSAFSRKGGRAEAAAEAVS